MTNLEGKQIDNYRVDKLLGEGGMGAVYKGYDMNLARPVAIKVMHGHLARNTQFQQRFMQEAQSAARLSHESIVDIYYFGLRSDFLYMVMEFVPGVNLGQYIRQLQASGQVIHLRETLAILAQIADALGYAHEQGVVHRDIKPDNVLLRSLSEPDREGDPPLRAVVTDFGLAKLREGGVETATGTVMGTLPYMSPEQVLGNKDIDGRSDLYSLGVMLYQLTTGQLPFEIKTPADAVVKHLNEAPQPPQVVRPGLPPRVVRIIEKALAKEPADRIQTGREMARAMRYTASGLTDDDVTQFAPASSIVSVVTQLQVSDQYAEPSRFGSDMTELPYGQQLLIATRGEEPRTVPMDKAEMIVGRGEECEVSLVAPGISRRHARLVKTNGGWQVEDLGSTNGTRLEGSKLLPSVPEEWDAGQVVRIGPYYLRWREAAVQPPIVSDLRSMAARDLDSQATEIPVSASRMISRSGHLSATIDPTSAPVEAGGQAEIQVELLNHGTTVDHYNLKVSGPPADWVSLDQPSAQLMPGRRSMHTIRIHPPRDSSAKAGRHPFRLQVSSTTDTQERTAVAGELEIKSYEKYAVDMRPQKHTNVGVSRVLIRNQGNGTAQFRVTGRDPSEQINFEPPSQRLAVEAGETGTVDFKISPRSRHLLGRVKSLPFNLQVESPSGDRRPLTGDLTIKSLVPGWVPALVGVMAVGAVVAGAGLFAYFRSEDSKATATIEAQALAQIQTAEAERARLTAEADATQNALEAAAGEATIEALTAVAIGDADGDGLTNAEEEELGTEPDNPDTDGDGLNDGQEVKIHGTKPLNADSDGDTVPDGQEIEQGSSPNNPDTDLDGVPDGIDPDPLNAATDTPTPSATPPNTPTSTVTPTPTATPTPTPSPTPLAYTTQPPNINGLATAAEWANASDIMTLENGKLSYLFDDENLYLLLDVTGDRSNRATNQSGFIQLPVAGDFFSLVFDVDGDGDVDENLDVRYTTPSIPGGTPVATMQKAYLDGDATATTTARVRPGFGTSPASNTPHRLWEIVIPLAEIQASVGSTIRYGVTIFSAANPSVFNESNPTNQSNLDCLRAFALGSNRAILLSPCLQILQPVDQFQPIQPLVTISP